MDRRTFLQSSLLAGAGLLAAKAARGNSLPGANAIALEIERAAEIVRSSTVIDMLGLLTLDWPRLYAWQREPSRFGPADFQRLIDSGVSIFHPAVEPNAPDPYRAALRWMNDWNSLVHGQPRFFLPVLHAADLDRARSEKRIGIVIGFQSSDHFRDIADVAFFHGLGQRVSQLTYNSRTRLGSGCRDSQDIGLTPFGRQVVGEMNRVGIAVDLSHCSERTTLESIELSDRPVLITHANCSAIAAHPRNKSDKVLRALAARGGVIGITSVKAFVKASGTLDDLLDHYVHVAQTAGVDHVGIGSDCDLDSKDAAGRIRPAYDIRGLRLERKAYDLAAGLLRRGFSEADLGKVLGGNFRRALGEIWPAPPAPPPPPAEALPASTDPLVVCQPA